jgi:4a-hydroxytetrahydrobiopterin dehydratase
MSKTYDDPAYLAEKVPGWEFDDNALEKGFKFNDFNEAFGFMTRVALVCEQMDHHPDWQNIYNYVLIRLWTHTEEGVTDLDIELANRIDEMIEEV